MLKYVCAVLLCSAIAAAVNVDKCKEALGPREGTYGSGALEEVRVSDCTDAPCKLKKGEMATIAFDFVPEKRYESLQTAVFGNVGIVRVPFKEVHGVNACEQIKKKSDGSPGCPLEPGTTYTYSQSFPIQKNYPAVGVNVQYGLNDNKNQVVCFSLPAKIVNP